MANCFPRTDREPWPNFDWLIWQWHIIPWLVAGLNIETYLLLQDKAASISNGCFTQSYVPSITFTSTFRTKWHMLELRPSIYAPTVRQSIFFYYLPLIFRWNIKIVPELFFGGLWNCLRLSAGTLPAHFEVEAEENSAGNVHLLIT